MITSYTDKEIQHIKKLSNAKGFKDGMALGVIISTVIWVSTLIAIVSKL